MANSPLVLEALEAKDDLPIQEAVEHEVKTILADTEVTPRNSDGWWALADSNRRAMLLEAIDAGASQFAAAKPIPGRVQRRIRHVLGYGGSASAEGGQK